MINHVGTIQIDGLDIAQISRTVTRDRAFIAIPQDPAMMPFASLRCNIDPTETVSDDLLVRALKKVMVWQHITSQDTVRNPAEVLDAPMSALPVLSSGQAQLLALARALAKREVAKQRKPIIVLDEATSSLDPESESLIHDVVDEEFVGNCYTVIMVTHRPALLVKRMREQDAAVVMKDGKIEVVRRGQGALQGVADEFAIS